MENVFNVLKIPLLQKMNANANNITPKCQEIVLYQEYIVYSKLKSSIKFKVLHKNLHPNIGKVFSVLLMLGMSRLFGDLIIHTALLKIHLWYL